MALNNTVTDTTTQNVYSAFMRCSRQYRNLKNLLRAGLVHDRHRTRAPGDLALFCVTCPQIGKNVSVDEVAASGNSLVAFVWLCSCFNLFQQIISATGSD
jgi:hypothetical protein